MRFTFLKDNSSSIVKLFINQIGVAIFSMFLYTAAGAISSDEKASLIVKVSISAFSMLFYYMLVYNVVWEIGAKDKIRIDAGRLKESPSKGIFLGLWANMPNFIVVGIALIIYIIYIFTEASVLANIFAIFNLIFRLFIALYLGVIQGICKAFSGNDNLNIIMQTSLYIVFSALSALVIHISYMFGLKDRRIFPNSKFKSNN